MGGLRSPTGRPSEPLKLGEPLKIKLLPAMEEPYHSYVMMGYAALEARMMASLLLVCCKACGEMVQQGCTMLHCRDRKDAAHLALEVMES